MKTLNQKEEEKKNWKEQEKNEQKKEQEIKELHKEEVEAQKVNVTGHPIIYILLRYII
jgi:hypothetical protein